MAYQSDYEKFLQEMRAEHPEWVGEQHKGLNLLWNRKINLAEQQGYKAVAEKQHAYPYDVNFR